MIDKERIILNPISALITEQIKAAKNKLLIAVPFISSYARKIIPRDNISNIKHKRLITKFDEENIHSFDIPTLQYLLENGFNICFNNKIHLKQYIIDDNAFITSSNLTRGGLEDNIELTVQVDQYNLLKSNKVFDELWELSKSNKITGQLLEDNYEKYKVLKKRQKNTENKKIRVNENTLNGSLNIEELIDEIFNTNEDHTSQMQLIYEANKKRNIIKSKLIKNKFETSLFYAREGHPKRRDNLFYEFVYGTESKLAGTGLREAQFKGAFEHPDFQSVIAYIYPDILGLQSWNLEDEKSFLNFCNGLFDFEIPQYSESIPIRLASFFYPEKILPIFKLDHLEKICSALGLDTDAKSKGERLFAYNVYLENKFKNVPINNYIKSNMAYHLFYSVELYKRLENGEKINDIKNSFTQQWKKFFIEKSRNTLKNIKAIQ
jgi:hypothetical protein